MIYKCIVPFIFCFSAFCAIAQSRSAKFDSLFSQLHRDNKFSGNVLIAENGKSLFQKSYGLAFREKGEALNSESIFELASVSKQFTAMGIMVLKKQGKLNYTDSLRQFFPQLPYANISIRQLLNHTSGLPDYIDLAASHWDSSKIMTNKDMINLLAEKKPPVIFSPGQKWEYSNTGYALLGSIIEQVSGQSFKDFMQKNIYRPLGMNRTIVYHKRLEKRSLENYAYGYVQDASRGFVMADSSAEVKSMVYSMDGIFGDGITNSTTTDLLKWDQALYSGKLISTQMMEEAFSPGTLNSGKKTDYGFGWFIKDHDNFGKSYYHSGGWPGYITWIERFPQSNKTIIILANAGNAMPAMRSIRNILFNIEEKEPVAIELTDSMLQQYTGQYLVNNDTLSITYEQGQLHAESPGQAKHILYPEKENLFFRKNNNNYSIQFLKDKAGKVSSLKILFETRAAMDAPKLGK